MLTFMPMRFFRVISAPLAILFWIVTSLRNFFYDRRLFKASKFGVPIISVGNLSVGGTGKSPHIEYLIRLLKDKFKVAVLSRGYGRTKRSFEIADEQSTIDELGDEPRQFHLKYGSEITVVAEPDRVKAVMSLMFVEPETEVILLDDAFQHRAIFRGLDILLTTYDEPFWKDWILPLGNLRESGRGIKRCTMLIVTKCPDLEKTTREKIRQHLRLREGQALFLSRIVYGDILQLGSGALLDDLRGRKVVLVTGIASAMLFRKEIEKSAEILHHFSFADHHRFGPSDIAKIHDLFDKFAVEDPVILTTEKDAMRLSAADILKYPWYFQRIEVALDRPEEFNAEIFKYVETNR